ncbi:DUF4269 domain-containing protein [Paenibacillus sp. YPG26]|uniref:DUF4269 domain-containing protein n=1 Tax=Paenibacillus sp. YPG26 TaxID=2878915 RepID=UPI00203C1AF5|nr:DUF4269 domain-containing protein [Paenibacillus sp. YPG26]USB33377.1 DUF4269 domain-containing protein [Paenibacillus sp. YPG26]
MKSEHHFTDSLEYLSHGSTRQKEVYQILTELNIYEMLSDFSPILVGTIPIQIDIPDSDLDIICEVYDFKSFGDLLDRHFKSMNQYSSSIKTVNEVPRIVCNFEYKGWLIEIFGQPVPTQMQNGYRHMIVENRILAICGDKCRLKIRNLKKLGLKTEPAFGVYLNLNGNPYDVLLEMYEWNEQKLKKYLR